MIDDDIQADVQEADIIIVPSPSLKRYGVSFEAQPNRTRTVAPNTGCATLPETPLERSAVQGLAGRRKGRRAPTTGRRVAKPKGGRAVGARSGAAIRRFQDEGVDSGKSCEVIEVIDLTAD